MTRESEISQLRVLPILVLMGCLAAAILWLSRSPALERYIFVRRQASWRIHADRCSLAGPYASMTERLLLDYAFRPDLARKVFERHAGKTNIVVASRDEESPIFEIEAPGKKEKTVKKVVPQKSIQISLFG